MTFVTLTSGTTLSAFVISTHCYTVFWHGVLFESRVIPYDAIPSWLARGWFVAPRAMTSAGVEVWKRVG